MSSTNLTTFDFLGLGSRVFSGLRLAAKNPVVAPGGLVVGLKAPPCIGVLPQERDFSFDSQNLVEASTAPGWSGESLVTLSISNWLAYLRTHFMRYAELVGPQWLLP